MDPLFTKEYLLPIFRAEQFHCGSQSALVVKPQHAFQKYP